MDKNTHSHSESPMIRAVPDIRLPSVQQRIAGKAIDLTLALLIAAVIPYPAGPFLGFVYSLVADAFNFGPLHGQSVGKRAMGLRAVHHGGHVADPLRGVTFAESVVRNAPIGVATFFALIPIWGWLILFLLGVPILAVEIYLMVRVETQQRLGDVMAGTQVVLDLDQGRKAGRENRP